MTERFRTTLWQCFSSSIEEVNSICLNSMFAGIQREVFLEFSSTLNISEKLIYLLKVDSFNEAEYKWIEDIFDRCRKDTENLYHHIDLIEILLEKALLQKDYGPIKIAVTYFFEWIPCKYFQYRESELRLLRFFKYNCIEQTYNSNFSLIAKGLMRGM